MQQEVFTDWTDEADSFVLLGDVAAGVLADMAGRRKKRANAERAASPVAAGGSARGTKTLRTWGAAERAMARALTVRIAG